MPRNPPEGTDPRDDLSPDVELELEILEGRTGATPSGEGGEAGTRRRRRLIVVDDDPALRAYARRCLARMFGEGAEVAEADDGAAALRLARAGGVDLFVCEVFLPGMGGFELVASVRADPALAATPVLLTAGDSLPRADRTRVDDLAGVALLEKPFNARKLRASVERLLG